MNNRTDSFRSEGQSWIFFLASHRPSLESMRDQGGAKVIY